MERKSDAPRTVDEYISTFPPAVRAKLERLRASIRDAAPEAVEKIGYGMPAYYLDGPLAYFAAFKNHIGFYPTPRGIEAFMKRLARYKSSKGSVQFPLDEEPPYDLVKEIVAMRAEENRAKAAGKKKGAT
jgi:uncharacterized protein YdhG (YjbR/CyaY superfamily)